MDGRCVDGNGFLGRDVRSIFEITVLSFLLSLEVETSKTTQVLSNNGLVNGCSASNTLSLGDVSLVF